MGYLCFNNLGVNITDCMIQSWPRGVYVSRPTHKNKPRVDYEPRSAHGRAVSNMSMEGTWCDALFVQAVADCQNVGIYIIESHENFVKETLIKPHYLA